MAGLNRNTTAHCSNKSPNQGNQPGGSKYSSTDTSSIATTALLAQHFPYYSAQRDHFPPLLPARAMSNAQTPSGGFFVDDSLPLGPEEFVDIPLSQQLMQYAPMGQMTPGMAPPAMNNTNTVAPQELPPTVHPVETLSIRNVPQKPLKKQPKGRPAFVTKLWTMVNDPSNDDLIHWCDDGQSFVVSNREFFVQRILPKYFKHSNFASFVRQLNMYGWHKVQDVSSGSLHSDERWQFGNPNFQKGKPELLDKIVRNKAHEEEPQEPASLDNLNVKLLVNELTTLKTNQMKITQELSRVRQDNELLWQELFTSREKNTLQNDKIEKILQFLASVYGNRVQVLEDDTGSNEQMQRYTQQQFYPVNPQAQQYPSFPKPRLMIQPRAASSTASSTPHQGSSVGESPIQEISRTPNVPSSQEIMQLLDDTRQDNDRAQMSSDSLRSMMPANPSLDSLSKTIEDQGHSINDIISKLQTQQYDQPPTFDLDEFLNQDFLPPTEEEKFKPGTIREIPDDVEQVQPRKRKAKD